MQEFHTQGQDSIIVLNDVTKTLIDSYKGYELAFSMVDDTTRLHSRLSSRSEERLKLIGQFQNEVERLGGTPESEGGALGKIHRAFARFSSLFQEDQAAALSAIDGGEEFLMDEIEDKLKADFLSGPARRLLLEAHKSERKGASLAEKLGKAA